VSHLFDYSGVAERYTYGLAGDPRILDPTGNERLDSIVANRFLFQGRDYLREGTIYDYRNRVYHPGLGRFMQPDPIGFKGDSGNLYRYCGNDPVDRSDPTGLDTFENLPDAIRFARGQVVKLAFGPEAHKEYFKEFHDMKTHGVSIGISSHGGKKFVTSEPAYGEFKSLGRNPTTGREQWYETEKAPKDAFMTLHSHNNKTGAAVADFSPIDKASARGGKIIDKVNETDPDNWQRIGPSTKSPGWKKMDPSVAPSRSDYSLQNSETESSVQTASQIDGRQRAAENLGTTVPSLGAEAVNQLLGPR